MSDPTITTPDDAHWSSFSIPDGEPEIGLCRLGSDHDGAFTVLVRFPPGWARPVTGWYDAAEEALILDGELTMSGRTHRAGEFARWGVDYTRVGTSTTDGATVLAWFSGLNRWTRGTTEHTELDAACRWREVVPVPVAAGELPPVRPLYRADDATVAVWDRPPEDCILDVAVNLFGLTSRRFAQVPAGVTLPSFDEPTLVRVRCSVDQLVPATGVVVASP